MFEPIHGSAPDIAGRGIANPIGAIWAAALMLDHLGQPTASREIVAAIERVLAEGQVRTPDLGGTATTADDVGVAAAWSRCCRRTAQRDADLLARGPAPAGRSTAAPAMSSSFL